MFKSVENVDNPPEKPTLVWDGNCSFCRYWVEVWERNTENRIAYKKYQEVHKLYSSIPLKEFKKASRLIETEGEVYGGPDSAYRSFLYFKNPIELPHRLYHENKFFKKLSDHSYNWIAKHRPFMYSLTKTLRGSDPEKYRPYWILWLILLGTLLLLIVLWLPS